MQRTTLKDAFLTIVGANMLLIAEEIYTRNKFIRPNESYQICEKIGETMEKPLFDVEVYINITSPRQITQQRLLPGFVPVCDFSEAMVFNMG